MPIILKKRVMFACLLATLFVQQVIANEVVNESTEHIIWDKTPIKITLSVGKERIITFPSPVWVDIPGEIHKKLRTQNNSNIVYWLAHEAFKTQRLEIGAVDGRTHYLVNLEAKKTGGSNEPIEIVLKKSQQQTKSAKSSERPGIIQQKSPGYIQLTRFAAQQLYSPARLLSTPAGVHRVPVSRDIITHLMRNTRIAAKPIASWRHASLYVTAIELKNQTGGYITLDPRMIRGQWKAATFQHVRLHPVGSESDTTALYLISNRPFHEVI